MLLPRNLCALTVKSIFDQLCNWKRHEKVCYNTTQFKFPGGLYEVTDTIFEKLEKMGIHTEQEDRYFPWFAFFDMESILEKTQEFQSEKLVWTAHHKPVSVSICSNVPGFTEPNCIVEADLDQLLMKMIDYLSGIQNEAKTLAYEKWNDVIEQLENNDDDDDE